MDTTEQIREKREELENFRNTDDISLVVRHLEAAERHFTRGKATADSEFFTDVIYRSNQVFEGILKEAYEVLTNSSSNRMSPYDIEKHFLNNDIFTARVMDYFSRYRTQWRNPSTHDHRLDFNEQEAFLALTTVTSFCYVVLDQMIQESSAQSAASISQNTSTNSDPNNLLMLSDMQSVTNMLVQMLPNVLSSFEELPMAPAYSEVQLIGSLQGMFDALVHNSNIIREAKYSVDGGSAVSPDLVVQDGEVTVIVEVKRVRPENLIRSVNGMDLQQQMNRYIHSVDADYGIVVIFTTDLFENPISEFTITQVGRKGEISFIHPVIDTTTT